MAWEVISTDDETKQLGNDEAITSLCEVVKLALLEPSEELPEKSFPKIRSCISYGYTCLAFGSCLFIFGENSSLVANISLENEIDVLICLPGAQFVLIGDCSGKIHCFHFESKQTILSRKIIEPEGSGSTFLHGKSFLSNDGVSIFILTSNGNIIELSYLDVDAIDEGIRAKDIPYLTSLKTSISLKYHPITISSEVLCADLLMYDASKLCVWFGLRDGLYVWTPKSFMVTDDTSLRCISNVQYTYVSQLFNGRYVVVLSDKRQMSILCGSSGIVLWDDDTEDNIQGNILQIQHWSLNSFNAQLLLLLNKNDEFSFYIFNVPSFEHTAEISVGKDPVLLHLVNEADSITYLEPEYEGERLLRFKLKCVIDGLPETRLTKLLKNHKYDEAEEFCIMFNLDLNQVLMAKSKYLCEFLNPWQTLSGNSMIMDLNTISKHLEELLLTMDRLDDHSFVTTICINAPMYDIKSTHRLLTYGKKRLAMAIKDGEGDEMSTLMRQVSNNLYCLNTFCSIFPSGDIHQWFSFARANKLEEFLDYLKRGNLDLAAAIWHRHQYEFHTDINNECVSRILNAIHYRISSEVLCAWLPKHLLRDLIQFCPSAIEIIAKWTDERIKTLEIVEKESWPQNGYKLATVTIEAIEKISADFYAGGNIEVQLAVHMVTWKAHSPSSCVYHLRQTALALKDLQFLAEKFFIKVKFSEYTQEDKGAVICALLDWLVSGDEIEPLIRDFINPFVRRFELNLDEILDSYVFNCLAISDCCWWMEEEAPWEDKVYAVIDVIVDTQIKAKCIVECVSMASVPWSEGTRKMCAIGMTLNSYVTDLQEQEHLTKLKIILRRYNLHFVNYETPYNARFILRSIVNREGETVLEDALTVISALKSVSTIDAYYYRIVYCLHSGSYNEVKNILTQLNAEDESKVCMKLITYFIEYCESFPNRKCREKLMNLYGSIPVLEPFFRKCVKMEYRDIEDIIEKFSRIRHLQVKYDFYPTLDEIEDSEFCVSYMKSFIANLYSKREEQQPNEPQNLNHTSSSFIGTQKLKSLAVGFQDRRKTLFPGGLEKRQSLAVNNLEWTRVSLPKSQKTLESTALFTEHDVNSSSEKSFSKQLDSLEHLSQLLGITRDKLLTLRACIANQKGYLHEALEYIRQLSEVAKFGFAPEIIHDLIKSASSDRQENTNKKGSSSRKEIEQGITKLILECISISLLHCDPGSIFALNEYRLLYEFKNILLEQCHFKGIYNQDNNIEAPESLKNYPFSEVYYYYGMPLDEIIISERMKTVLQRASFVHSKFHSHSFERNSAEIYGEPKIQQAVSDLVHHLHERSHEVIALFISQNTFDNVHINKEIPNFVLGIKKENILTLLMKILNSKQKDLSFALSLLSLLSIKEALKVMADVIKRLGYDFSRLLTVGEIGCEYCNMNKMAEIKTQFSALIERATWGITLEGLGISFRPAFSGNKIAIQEIVNNLISNTECSFVVLENFCRDFSLDSNMVLLSYLKMTIRTWMPLSENNMVKNSIINAPPSLFRKIETIISKINNEHEVIKALKEELQCTSSYDYEVIDLILRILSELEPESKDVQTGKNILQFLQTYDRQCEPGDYEKNEWLSVHHDSKDLPSISKFRLPFHKLLVLEKKSKEDAEKWKTAFKQIMEKEINWNTVEKWTQLSFAIKFTTDQLYFIATENTLTSALRKDTNAESQEWQVCSTNTSLLSQLQSMVAKINNPNLSIACAHHIVNNLPPGVDKVEAAKKCVLLVNQFSLRDDSNMEIKPFQERYQQLAVEHALHKYGLATSEYLKLISDPSALMYALYEHPSLSPRVTLNTEHYLDINGCVKDICNIVNCQLETVQSDLLSKWLPLKVFSADDNDETVSNFNLNFDQDVVQKEGSNLFEDSLSRTIYLLRCFPQEQAISYLLEQALSSDENVGSWIRLKALRCLLAIADEEAIQNHSVKSMAEFRSLLQTLTYVNRLELLGHAVSQKSFSSMDKNALVEGIWRAHRHNPEALLLLVDICHDYKITTASMWEAVLAQIRSFVEIARINFEDLEKVLIQIRNIPHLWVLSQMTSAWTFLIYYPFKKANNPISETSLWQCVHAVNLLLQSCPVDVDVNDLLSLSLSLNLPILALAIAGKVNNKEEQIQMILRKYSKEELKGGYEKVKTSLALPQNIEDHLATLENSSNKK